METIKRTISKRTESSPIFGSNEVSLGRFGTDVDLSTWSPRRKILAAVLIDPFFELVLAILVIISVATAVVDTDHNSEGQEVPGWVSPIEYVLLFLFSLEMAARAFVLRLKLFEVAHNMMDLGIVLVDMMFFVISAFSLDLPHILFFRLLRLGRLGRVLNILLQEQQLYLMVEGLMAALKTIFFGCVFIAIALLIFSIIAVEYLYPLEVEFSSTCTRCPVAFESVYASLVTIFQTIIVCDEFGDHLVPYVVEHPHTIIFVVIVFVTINFGLLNLIMAVIVDGAAQARIRNTKEMAEEKDKEFQSNQKMLYKLCQEMDSDGSNSITLDELVSGYDNHLDFRRTLCTMDLNKDDLVAVFNILDEDSSGTVGYKEFVEQLYKMKANDSNRMLVFIQHYVTELRKNVAEELQTMKQEIEGGMQKLHNSVGEGLKLIKDDMQINMKALDTAEKRLELDLQKETDMLEQEQSEEQRLAADIKQETELLKEQESQEKRLEDDLQKETNMLKEQETVEKRLEDDLERETSIIKEKDGPAEVQKMRQVEKHMEQEMKTLEDVEKRLESDIPKEGNLSKQKGTAFGQEREVADRQVANRQAANPSPSPAAELPESAAGKLAAPVQLHILTEQISAVLEDPRCKCENFAVLLTTFNGLLPHTTGEVLQQFSSVANVLEGKTVESVNSWPPKASFGGKQFPTGESGSAECLRMLQSGGTVKCVQNVEASGYACLDLSVCSSHPHEWPSQRANCTEAQAFLASRDTSAGDSPRSFHSLLTDMSNYRAHNHHAGLAHGSSHRAASPPATLHGTCLEFAFEDSTQRLGFEVQWVQDEPPRVGKVGLDTAADVSGVRQGDRIIEVNSVSILTKDRAEILKLLRMRPLLLKIVRVDE